ncbi:hypothetical protein NTE_02154 [Candidatus Nitrososphaera evergladensis SR1]|jgi:hypothetical protein|uniref:Uncharacterized protein n=1 Tax=Candidatus Nitrososphaera evergladensis SR1 TaxID=1459636 RepID=A0A075MST7_9ARCH|nr:hypothetical protein NTE_02154 [Candidatus Nitrososphaera evergladensis SR1]
MMTKKGKKAETITDSYSSFSAAPIPGYAAVGGGKTS